jgi:SAM-dependent methyltransferase
VTQFASFVQVDKTSGCVSWESSSDLSKYLAQSVCNDTTRLSNVIEKSSCCLSVVELGCGTAIPSLKLATLLHSSGYSGRLIMYFQDLSPETIESVTKPNVLTAFSALGDAFSKQIEPHFVASSWDDFVDVVGAADIILSSECVYREDLFESHSHVIERILAPDGIALVAAKRYYFGCGGGTIEFADYVAQKTALKAELAAVFENGMSNTREILAIYR